MVSAKWDFEGVGTYPDAAELDDPTSETVRVAATHAFIQTRAPTFRRYASPPNVSAISNTPFARSLNLSRVRVVVDE